MDFLCYFIMSFRYWFFTRLGQALMMCVCGIFKIFVAKPGMCSFTGLANAILHWISSNNLFMCSAEETFSLLFQFSFPQALPLFTFIVAFCFPQRLSCRASFFHSFNQFSFFSFLLTLTMHFPKLSSATAVLTRTSLLCAACFARLHLSSSTQPSTLARLLPSSLFGM